MLTFKKINTIGIIILTILLFCNYFLSIHMGVYIILIIVWFTITSIGSFNIGLNYHLKALNKNPFTKTKQIAITFDDGPNDIYTPQVLKLLESYNAKASFFCIGKHIEIHPMILKKIVNQGHTIGNHTYSHSYLTGFFRKKKVIHEIQKTKKIVEKLVGKKMKLFRPPFGVTNPSIAKAIQQERNYVIGWNIRSLDTIMKDQKKILNKIKNNISPGAVILLHDTTEKSVAILEQLLLFLHKNGYQPVTVDTLFNIEAYD